MVTQDFGVDIDACRENFYKRQERRRQQREAVRQATREAILGAVHKVLPDHPEVKSLYLFGSIIRENAFGPESDIDVAVEGTNAEQYFTLWRHLQDAVPERMVDLREINKPSYFADTVRERGELIYER